jgi:dihydrofolate reductase
MSGRLILLMSVSLDGYVARTDGRIDWLGRSGRHGDQRHRLNLELFGQLEAMVMGSGAYLEFKEGWSGSDNPMARFMNAMPKVVDWSNSRLTRRPLAEEVPELKRAAGKDLVIFGGARIAHSAIREGLVDEYRLTVHPVMLGDGLSFMHGQPEPVRLELVSSTAYTDGSVMQVLRPA